MKRDIFGRYNCFCHGCGKEIPYSQYHKNLRLYDMGCCDRCIENMNVGDKMKQRKLVKDRWKRKWRRLLGEKD